MDFTRSEEQAAVRDLANQLFTGMVSVDRVKTIEAAPERLDRELWSSLAEAGIQALPVPETFGGSGLGILEVCEVLEQQGRVVAPLPLADTLVGALTIAKFASVEQQAALLPGVADGSTRIAIAANNFGENDPARSSVLAKVSADGWVLSGSKPIVSHVGAASVVLVPAEVEGSGLAVFIVPVDAKGLTIISDQSTNREMVSTLTFADTPVSSASVLGASSDEQNQATRHLIEHLLVALAALQVGVAEEITKLAAEYTSTRNQFGKPLSTFQGVSHRLADNYIATEAMRVTMQLAAWRLANGLDASTQVMVAKWWAAEGGHRVIHGAQHVHGGMGADIDYPSHRYFLWGKQTEAMMGGASAWLARLGSKIAVDAKATT